MKTYFTSESVTEGHPDKICDQISDAILDSILENDPEARVACEVCITTGMVLVMGEITTDCYCDIPKIVRNKIKEIGYNSSDMGFDYNSCAVITSIDEQSKDISQGVDLAMEFYQHENTTENSYITDVTGAGDQGLMFGYACNETPELMPLPISLAHRLAKRLAYVRKSGILPYLRPDGKSQVTVEYEDGIPKRIDAVVISSQHTEDVDHDTLAADIKKHVIAEILPKEMVDKNTRYYINPTGRFVIGGPAGDSGLTGRKIIVDTYGGYARHGGGAFSGKDPTKVDRSAAYMARYIAKNIVAAGIADKCEIGLSYAIGVANPISILVDTFKTNKIPEEKISQIVHSYFNMQPGAIIKELDLKKPIYSQLASYGHFGRTELDVKWEITDHAEALKELAFGK